MDKGTIQKQSVELTKELDNPQEFCKKLYAIFKSNVDKKTLVNYQRIIPKMGKTFGTPLPILRIIAVELGKYGQKNPQSVLSILKILWKNGSFEEQQIVGKVIEQMAKKHPKECLNLIPSFLPTIDNWANCDNLACFGMEPIIISNTDEVLSLCEKWVEDKNKWIRRFGVVTLRAYKLMPISNKVFKILDSVMKENDPDVKKSVSWILREITKKNPEPIFEFLIKWAKTNPNKDTIWIIKDGMKKLDEKKQGKILGLLK